MPLRSLLTRSSLFAVTGLLALAAVVGAHDMFLRPTRYFLAENAEVVVQVLNLSLIHI